MIKEKNVGHTGSSMKFAFLFYFYATVLTLMPALPFAGLAGSESAYLFLTGDAYLYLGIAEHSTDNVFSFDGERPTNGFHPLWQAILWLIAQLTDSPLTLMNSAAWGAIFFTWIGVLLLGTAVARITGSWLLSGLVVPGIYFIIVGQGVGGNLSVWDFFNGMEAGLALGLTGAIALLVSYAQADEQRLTFWLSLGILTGLLMLCRLDEVFVSAAIGVAWLAWSPRQAIRRLPAVVALGLPPLLMLAGYLAYNLSYAGTAMPVSGAAKGEGALLQNGWVTLVTFFAPIIELRSLLTDYAASPQSLAGADFRVAQLVFPAVAAMCFVAAIAIHFRSAPWAPFVVGMCVAIVVKAAYNGLAVGYWHQASWYFAFAQGTISFTAALLLAPAVADWRDKSPLAVSLAAALIAAISFLQASQSYLGRSSQLPLTDRQRFFEAGPEINAAIEALTPGAKVLEFGDGLINFTLDRPVRHGFVFAGDLYSLEALQSGNLLQASYGDGYNVMTSFEYYRWPGITTDHSSDEIRQFLAQLGASYGIRGELINFEFEVIYVYEPLNIPFIKFEPL